MGTAAAGHGHYDKSNVSLINIHAIIINIIRMKVYVSVYIGDLRITFIY